MKWYVYYMDGFCVGTLSKETKEAAVKEANLLAFLGFFSIRVEDYQGNVVYEVKG